MILFLFFFLFLLLNFELEAKKDEHIHCVDALSKIEEVLVVDELSFEGNLAIIQSQDKSLESIRNSLEKNNDCQYELRNGVIYKKIEKDELKILVPKAMETHIIKNCHECSGHDSVEKTVEIIRRNY